MGILSSSLASEVGSALIVSILSIIKDLKDQIPVYLKLKVIFFSQKTLYCIGQNTFQNNHFNINVKLRLLNIKLLSPLV